MQFEDSRHLQEYAETDGSITYLQNNRVKQLIIIWNYMILLIKKERPADQKCSVMYFILDDPWLNLTAHDMRTALVNAGLEYHEPQTIPRSSVSNSTPHSSSESMRSTIHVEHAPLKKGIKPDDPPQDVDKPHLSASISTITNLDVTCTLDTSCDHLLHLDFPSHSSDPQDIPSAESVEIEFLLELEGQLDHANHSPPDVFHEHHDYDLFLLNQEIDTPSDSHNHQDTLLFRLLVITPSILLITQ